MSVAGSTTTRPATPAPYIARRDPGHWLWGVAALCWVVTVVVELAHLESLGHHDVVLEESTSPVRSVFLFALVWQIMIGAMMLPTTVPMVRAFWAVTGRAARGAWSARTVFIGSYVVIWGAFGLLALAGDTQVHAVVERSHWLHHREGLILAGALVVAGGYQLAGWKARCLTACRNPVSLLWQWYRPGTRGALALGVRHAGYCVGCCWALMLVTFATGVANLLLMAVLTGVMLAEKVLPSGHKLVRPVGVGLLLAGTAVGLPALVV